MAEWIIEIQESQIRRKRHDVSWLWKEHDGCARELEERKRLSSSESKVASVRAAFSWAKEQAIKEYRRTEDFKNETLEGSQVSYWTRYEDGRDVVGRLYLDLDLSCIDVQESENELDETIDAPVKEALTNEISIKVASVGMDTAPVLRRCRSKRRRML